MSSLLVTLPIIISTLEFITGIFGNGFIVLINGIDWVKKKKTSLFDFILMCLASSRICSLCSTLVTVIFDLTGKEQFFSENVLVGFAIFWTKSIYFSTASTTCLTAFYFFKIANFSSPIFLWAKHRMRQVLLIIVVGTVLSFCVSVSFTGVFTNTSVQDWVNRKQNFTYYYAKNHYEFLTYFFLLNIVLSMLFVVSLSFFLLLVLSIWSHSKRMKLQGLYSRDSSMEAHIRAMRAMIVSLLLFITEFGGTVMLLLAYSADSVVAKILAHLLIFLFPSIHPFLLISWNNKLKQASLCVLRKLKCVKDNHPLF